LLVISSNSFEAKNMQINGYTKIYTKQREAKIKLEKIIIRDEINCNY
jgi:hypothetical protein